MTSSDLRRKTADSSHDITVKAATACRSFTPPPPTTTVLPYTTLFRSDGNNATNTVSEGASNGDLVGITATSSDVNGGTVTFTLSDSAGGRFAIDGSKIGRADVCTPVTQ